MQIINLQIVGLTRREAGGFMAVDQLHHAGLRCFLTDEKTPVLVLFAGDVASLFTVEIETRAVTKIGGDLPLELIVGGAQVAAPEGRAGKQSQG